jgi:16S rRNA (guanine966-N2)-methyltransferase
MDPPYQQQLEKHALEALKTSSLVDEYTTIIIEADLADNLSYIEEEGYEIVKIKKYKTNQHIFIKRG